MNVLEIKGLKKKFGKHQVLDNLSFSVPEHSIFGFIGQNGTGKTTTMKIILGLLSADEGEVFVCGEKVCYGETKTNRNIGYLPDVPEFYSYMNPIEYLHLCGNITGLNKREIKERSERYLNLVGIVDWKQKIGGFSRGMKQRLGIAQALLNEPKLLICDEPTSALDPLGRKELLDILHSIKLKTTVLFSTHILADVERICDHIALLHDRKLLLCGELNDIKNTYQRNCFYIEPIHAHHLSLIHSILEHHASILQLENTEKGILVHVHSIEDMSQFLMETLSKHHIALAHFELQEPTLENLFMEVIS